MPQVHIGYDPVTLPYISNQLTLMTDAVNVPVVYSVAFLATMSKKHKHLARQWVDFLLRPEGTQVWMAVSRR